MKSFDELYASCDRVGRQMHEGYKMHGSTPSTFGVRGQSTHQVSHAGKPIGSINVGRGQAFVPYEGRWPHEEHVQNHPDKKAAFEFIQSMHAKYGKGADKHQDYRKQRAEVDDETSKRLNKESVLRDADRIRQVTDSCDAVGRQGMDEGEREKHQFTRMSRVMGDVAKKSDQALDTRTSMAKSAKSGPTLKYKDYKDVPSIGDIEDKHAAEMKSIMPNLVKSMAQRLKPFKGVNPKSMQAHTDRIKKNPGKRWESTLRPVLEKADLLEWYDSLEEWEKNDVLKAAWKIAGDTHKKEIHTAASKAMQGDRSAYTLHPNSVGGLTVHYGGASVGHLVKGTKGTYHPYHDSGSSTKDRHAGFKDPHDAAQDLVSFHKAHGRVAKTGDMKHLSKHGHWHYQDKEDVEPDYGAHPPKKTNEAITPGVSDDHSMEHGQYSQMHGHVKPVVHKGQIAWAYKHSKDKEWRGPFKTHREATKGLDHNVQHGSHKADVWKESTNEDGKSIPHVDTMLEALKLSADDVNRLRDMGIAHWDAPADKDKWGSLDTHDTHQKAFQRYLLKGSQKKPSDRTSLSKQELHLAYNYAARNKDLKQHLPNIRAMSVHHHDHDPKHSELS